MEPLVEVESEKEISTTESEENYVNGSEISEEEEACFHDINLLLEEGIPKEHINKLKKSGINTIKGIQMTFKNKLLLAGLNEAELSRILQACAKFSFNTAFTTAAEVSEQRKSIFKLTTGSKNLDKLLGGGVEAMSITEVFGEFRTGKTQLAHTLCVTAQMPGINGYIGGKVIYIDTEHTFRPDRLRAIADRFNLDQTSVLENVLYARAYNSDHQYELLNNIAEKLHEEAGIFKLLIIDSIMALFRVDYSGRGEIAARQMKLARMLSRLQNISEEYNIAIFVTNQITSDFTVPQVMGTVVSKPIGGNIMAHASTTRLSFKKGEGSIRSAHLFDSPELQEGETEFIITAGGVDDVHYG